MRRVPAALVLVLWVGCGGGVPDINDRTPPELVSWSPEDGSTLVPIGAEILFTFDETVQETFEVQVEVDGVPVSVGARRSADDTKTIVIDPPAVSTLPANVTVTLSGVEDIFGNLADPQPSLGWTYPEWIPYGEQLTTAAGLRLAAGPTGPVVAWLSGTAVQVSRWNGSSWDALASPGTATTIALLADPGDGAPLVVLGGNPYVVRRYASGSWSTVGNTIPAQSTPSLGTALAHEGGALHVAFANAYSSGSCNAGTQSGCGRVCVYRLSGAPWQPGAAWEARACLGFTWSVSLTGFGADGLGVVIGNGTAVRRLPDATPSSTGTFTTLGSVSDVTAVGAYGGIPIALVGGAPLRWSFSSSVWQPMSDGITGAKELSAFNDTLPVVLATSGGFVKVLRWNPTAEQWEQLGADFAGTSAQAERTAVATTATGNAVYRSIDGMVAKYNE